MNLDKPILDSPHITMNKTNSNNIKTDEYGITILDKSKYSSKQVPSFKYNEKGRNKILEIIRGESIKIK